VHIDELISPEFHRSLHVWRPSVSELWLTQMHLYP